MKYSALVPVKALSLAKSRLASYLPAQQREALVLDMLNHVIHVLCESEVFEQVYVVSADSRILELAQHWGAEALRETQPGHNPALQAAALTILERAAWRRGAYSAWTAFRQPELLSSEANTHLVHQFPDEGLLTISADLPLLTPEDIQALIQKAENYQIVLAGSTDGSGTNALLTRPPLAIPYLFGPNSLPAYIHAIQTQHISYTLYENTHLGLDIDTQEDIQTLERSGYTWFARASCVI